MAYYHDFEKMKENLNVNVYKKLDLIKSLKPEEKQEIDLFKLLEENSKNVTDEEIAKLILHININLQQLYLLKHQLLQLHIKILKK